MKYLTLILLICVSSFSLNKIVIPQRASSGSVITASKTNENFDTIASKFNKTQDSIDIKFIRYSDLSSGDSTLRSKRADFDTTVSDTIRSKRADFDTTVSDTMYNSGGLYSERVSTPSAGITRANIDTSKTRHLNADSATISVFKGTKIIRDSSAFTGGVNIARVWTPQLNIINGTAGRVVVTDASRNLSSSTVTATELGYLLNKNSVIDGSGTSGNIPVFTGTNRLGNGPIYKDTTFACSLFYSSTFLSTATGYIQQIGDVINVCLPRLEGSKSGEVAMRLYGLPPAFFNQVPTSNLLVCQDSLGAVYLYRFEFGQNANFGYLVQVGTGISTGTFIVRKQFMQIRK